MYNKVTEFIEDWNYESGSTLKVFENLTDDSISFKPNKNVRSPGKLAWHIVTSLGEMVHRTGLKFDTVAEDSPISKTVNEIYEEFKRTSDKMVIAIEQEWNDLTLQKEIEMYGEMWKISKVLSVVVKHQTHHRGQLTVIMHLAGLKVPDVYGPAKEEWANMGMEAQE